MNRDPWDRTRPVGADVGEWDAALRLSDRVSHHLVSDREVALFQWIAVRLSDGGGDDTLYPTRDHAVAAQLAPEHMAFLAIPPDAMSPRAAWRYLRVTREMRSRWATRFDATEFFPIVPARIELARGVLQ